MVFSNVGADRRGVENTTELKAMKYKESVKGSDREAWANEIKNKHDQMFKNDAWKPVNRMRTWSLPM
jgi:hypothetical protein